jgi:hypothetical protein
MMRMVYATPKRQVEIGQVRFVVESGAFLGTTDDLNNSLLHMAILSCDITSMHNLLFLGAKVDVRGHEGQTPCHLALMSSNSTILRRLLKEAPNLNLQNNNGDTAMHFLFDYRKRWDVSEIEAVIQSYQSYKSFTNLRNNKGETLLHKVILAIEQLWALRFLSWCLHRSDEGDVQSPMPSGSSPLEHFLSTFLGIRQCSSQQLALIFLCLERFLRKGADPHTLVGEKPLLYWILEESTNKPKEPHLWWPAMEILLARIDLEHPQFMDGSPLHRLLKGEPGPRIYNAMKILIDRYAKINGEDSIHNSLIDIWLNRSHYPMVDGIKLLVRHGAYSLQTEMASLVFLSVEDQEYDPKHHCSLIQVLLESDIENPNPSVDCKNEEWVRFWRRASGSSGSWEDVQRHLKQLQRDHSKPPISFFDECVLTVIARRRLGHHQEQLRLWQAGFLSKEKARTHRLEYIAILKDCRGLHEIEKSWYEFLLEIMDFD